MKIYEYKPGCILPGGAVIALGLFDGLHEGHRSLLKRAGEIAKARGLTFEVFTFRTETLRKGGGALYPTEEKLNLMKDLGVEAVILSDFNEISSVSAEDFAKKLLSTEMGCEVAVCGFDFRFGKGALGNAELLGRLMAERGKECVVENERKIDGEKISTTKIKELLGKGDVMRAREFLGVPFFISAEVEHGRGEGRALGFPTVNLCSEGLSHLKKGVYRCAVSIERKLFSGVTNVGTCPTFPERDLHAEVNIIDFDGDLYGKNLRVFFLDFLREEQRFTDKESLILQIIIDKNKVIKENGDITWQAIGLKSPQPET